MPEREPDQYRGSTPEDRARVKKTQVPPEVPRHGLKAAAPRDELPSPDQEDPGVPEAEARETLDLLNRVLAALEERFELLFRAVDDAEIVTPGLMKHAYRHRISPHGASIVKHLVRTLPARPALLKTIQVVLVRFQSAQRLRDEITTRTLRDRPVSAATVRAVRAHCYHLGSLGEAVREDYVLSQLFPSPRQAGPARTAARTGMLQLSTTQPLDGKQAADQEARKRKAAESLLRNVLPGYERLKPLRPDAGLTRVTLSGLMSSGWPGFKLLSMRLIAAPETLELVQQFLSAVEALESALEHGGPGFTREATVLSMTLQRCEAHPLLADLLTAVRSS